MEGMPEKEVNAELHEEVSLGKSQNWFTTSKDMIK